MVSRKQRKTGDFNQTHIKDIPQPKSQSIWIQDRQISCTFLKKRPWI